MGGDTHYYITHEPILGIAMVGDRLLLCELKRLVIRLLEGLSFKPLGTIHKRVLLRELKLIQPCASLALPVKHWLKSKGSMVDQSLLSVASAFWR